MDDAKIRQNLKDAGADKVRHNSDGSWDTLQYNHPNHASRGKWLFAGFDNDDVCHSWHFEGIGKTKTETEINDLGIRFAIYIADDHGRGCNEDDTVRTSESVQNFIDACREYRQVDKDFDEFEGMNITYIEGYQLNKGDQRTDLYILNVEDDVRLVLNI